MSTLPTICPLWLRGNLCVQWIKTDKLAMPACLPSSLPSHAPAHSLTHWPLAVICGGFLYFLLSHIIYHCSLASRYTRGNRNIKIHIRIHDAVLKSIIFNACIRRSPLATSVKRAAGGREGGGRRSNMRNGLSKKRRKKGKGLLLQ